MIIKISGDRSRTSHSRNMCFFLVIEFQPVQIDKAFEREASYLFHEKGQLILSTATHMAGLLEEFAKNTNFEKSKYTARRI